LYSRPEDLNETFKEVLNNAIAERDEMWRKHEKAQIAYVQDRNAQLLSRLHAEIECLHNANRALERRLFVNDDMPDSTKLEEELCREKEATERLKENLAQSEKRNISMAQTLEKTAELYKNQVTQHEDRIRQLTNELHDRTLTVTQLSQQLRNFRLREAIGQAQQRRRSSFESSKQTSPTAFRLFGSPTMNSLQPIADAQSTQQRQERIKVAVPDNAILKRSATITVSYPQPTSSRHNGGRLLRTQETLTDNSIEKPPNKPRLTGSVSLSMRPNSALSPRKSND
jgi:DNA repair exonuclease SbcCD ATPase subunit